MPVSQNTVSITGSTASFDVQASGSGFGLFSSYSVFASQALAFSPGEVSGVGSLRVSIETGSGDLVFSGSDTVGVVNNDYILLASESLSFITDSVTFSLSSGGSIDGGSNLAGLQHDFDVAYSAAASIAGGLSSIDTIASAAVTDILSDAFQIKTAASTVFGGGSPTTHTLSDNLTIKLFKLS